jgi:hypothetical protein
MFDGVITLPMVCPDWIFYTSDCCLATGISTVQAGQGFYLEAGLNTSNNSAVLTVDDVVSDCIDQQFILHFGAIDSDNDSLVYSLVDVFSAYNTPVLYSAGLSGTNPLHSNPAIMLDPTNGDLTTQLTMPEYGIISVRIDEYSAGILKGYSIHDISVIGFICNNNPPVIVCPTQLINIEATEPFCLDIISSDPDSLDYVTLAWNASIPSATFTMTGNQFLVGHFCWTPSAGDIQPQPYSVVISAMDNNCPAHQVSCTFGLVVTPFTGINKITDDDIKISGLEPGLFKLQSSGLIKDIIVTGLSGNFIAVYHDEFIDLRSQPAGMYFINASTLSSMNRFRVVKE